MTARRVSESLQKVPESIGVVAPQVLANRNIQSLGDMRGAVADMFVQNSPVAGGTQLALRGVLAQSIPNATVFSSVGMYVDGVYLGRPVNSAGDIAGLERIEVLRGPQGTLFGRNASGGAINFITGEPTERYGVDASVGLGNYDERRGTVTINTGRFACGGFAARVSLPLTMNRVMMSKIQRRSVPSLFSRSISDFTNLAGFEGGQDADAVMAKLRYDGLAWAL